MLTVGLCTFNVGPAHTGLGPWAMWCLEVLTRNKSEQPPINISVWMETAINYDQFGCRIVKEGEGQKSQRTDELIVAASVPVTVAVTVTVPHL